MVNKGLVNIKVSFNLKTNLKLKTWPGKGQKRVKISLT